MKHKNTQPLYIFNRVNPQNSEPQNGPRRGLDFIALYICDVITTYKLKILLVGMYILKSCLFMIGKNTHKIINDH